MKITCIDLRGADEPKAVAEEATHVGVHGVLTDDPDLLANLPPTLTRIGLVSAETADTVAEELAAGADVLVLDHERVAAWQSGRDTTTSGPELGTFVVVDDHASLEAACRAAAGAAWTVIDFKDPTKIPLEIVLAAADEAEGRIVTVAHDVEEAGIVLGVLERGSDGVLLDHAGVGDATALAALAVDRTPRLEMQSLEIESITHVGLGDRVCVDTCSHLGPDEGILVGSFAHGMILCCSETHPLPYMPTRPFRVNAGALHSYALGPENRTRYLSELRGGSELLAVRTTGETRRVVVGRAKIETRPLLRITARSPDSASVDLVVQDDWHVRVLGPSAEVRNVTELAPGDRVAGHVLTRPRHVGYAVREFLLEQ